MRVRKKGCFMDRSGSDDDDEVKDEVDVEKWKHMYNNCKYNYCNLCSVLWYNVDFCLILSRQTHW